MGRWPARAGTAASDGAAGWICIPFWMPPADGTASGASPLRGETLVRGEASGVLLGGCITLIEDLIGTPWELDTRGSILLLEDCGVKPYQLDRMLLHLKQAGKFGGVRGIILGEFPESEAPAGSS